MSKDGLIQEALQLNDDQLEQVWLAEAAKRARELDEDTAQPVSSEEVSKRAFNLLQD